MNTYSTQFFCYCPSNDIRILYRLRIECEADVMVRVEDITTAVESLKRSFHEEAAEVLAKSLPGRQVLTADHHGVTIETIRNGRPSE